MTTPYPRSNPNNLALTPFQMATLELICKGNPEGSGIDAVIDLDQLLERLAMQGRVTTKQSMQFMIRTLIGKGLIEKQTVGVRRGWSRVGYSPTQTGLDIGAPRPQRPAFLESPDPWGLDIPEGPGGSV